MGAVDKIKEALRTALPTLAVSNGSIEQKIIDVVGTYADSEVIERENTLTTIRTALAEQKVTSVEYYRRKAVEYQAGDTLEFDPVNFGAKYPIIDTSKQIVKQACIVGEFPDFALRVNKIGDDGHLTTLNETELADFKTYFAEFQPLGLSLAVESRPVAKITDPDMVVYIQSGYEANEVATQINAAFTATESILRKTNKVTTSELVDIVQSVQGVVAVGFSSNLKAEDTDIFGSLRTILPYKGLFGLTTNAFKFDTQITASMIKVLQ